MEVAIVRFRVEVTTGQLGANGEPARANGGVLAEELQAAPAQAEVLDHVQQFDGLLVAAVRLLLLDDQVDVDVGVDEVSVRAASHRAFNAHQAMLLQGT